MTRLSVWAPNARRVEAQVSGRREPLQPQARAGWWGGEVAGVRPGTDYAFVLDGADPLPDPRSLWQPHGVHGPSRVYDHDRFDWSDDGWHGRALPGAVLYELHVGTFTREGSFDAAITRLGHLVELGITHVEVMPVAAFSGRHGWGYDGVDLYAVHEPYGGPDGFKRFIDACHARGLGVVLDVVYNHLGPSGNYLPRFGPYFTEAHHTPWGAAVNLDDAGSDEVRAFFVDNALMWLRDYHVDGLRLDAVHALVDTRAITLLEQLSTAVDALAAQVNRPLFLVAETDRNDPATITPREAGGLGLHAQWDDDVHHALHALLTGERQGYYADFGSFEVLRQVLTAAFHHAGTWSSFRGRTHGRPVDPHRTPGWRFVAFLQDHDQIGNRASGDRLSASVSPGLLACGAALLLTGPFTPMLFMGEEWAASTPWQYFTAHEEPELARAVTEGRRREFAEHGWDAEVPDPQDSATLARSVLDWSVLDWSECETAPTELPHAWVLRQYRELIALRRSRPELTDGRLDRVQVAFDAAARWVRVYRGGLRVLVNLGAERRQVPTDRPATGVLLASGADVELSGTGVVLDGESFAIVTTQNQNP